MRLGIVAFGLVSSSVAGYAAHTRGYPNTVTAAVTVGAFLIVLFVAWVFAVRFRRHRYEKDPLPNACPNCGQYIGVSDGWMTVCGACGWKPGMSVLRWFTHSKPALEVRRIVRSPKLITSVLALSVAFLLVVSGAAPVDFSQEGVSVGDDASDGADRAVGDESTRGIDEERVEQLIREYTREKRSSRDLDALEWNEKEQSPARQHAEYMENREYIGHRGSSGETISQRYSGACAENVVGTSPTGSFSWKTFPSVEVDTSQEAARHFVDAWMNSEGHRENILNPGHDSIAVGVSHDEESGGTYAVQVFCRSG